MVVVVVTLAVEAVVEHFAAFVVPAGYVVAAFVELAAVAVAAAAAPAASVAAAAAAARLAAVLAVVFEFVDEDTQLIAETDERFL